MVFNNSFTFAPTKSSFKSEMRRLSAEPEYDLMGRRAEDYETAETLAELAVWNAKHPPPAALEVSQPIQ